MEDPSVCVVDIDHTPARTGLLLCALEGNRRVWVRFAPSAPPELRAWVATLQDICGNLGHFEHGVYVPHIRAVDDAPEQLTAAEELEGDERFLVEWKDALERGDDVWLPADLGLRLCDRPAEDSVCCDHEECERCATFTDLAREYGVYTP